MTFHLSFTSFRSFYSLVLFCMHMDKSRVVFPVTQEAINIEPPMILHANTPFRTRQVNKQKFVFRWRSKDE